MKNNSGEIKFSLALRKNSQKPSPEKSQVTQDSIKVNVFKSSKKQDKYFNILRDFAFVKKSKKSIAMSRRISRKFFGNFQSQYLGKRALSTYIKINLKNPYNFFLMLAYVPVISSWIQFLLERRYPYPFELESICEKYSPDRIILMSTGDEPCLFEIPLVAKVLGFDWELIVDNWDNLSSKTVFWEKPKNIYVWGKDHANYAADWHGFTSTQIFEIGTPRIKFPETLHHKTEMNNCILYIGMQKPYDEVSDLEIIKNFCDYNQLELIYRPHPMKKFTALEEVGLISLLKQRNFHINHSENFRSNIVHTSFTDLVEENEFTNLTKETLLSIKFRNIITTPGSLALESLIYGHPIIVIARNDGVYKTTASIAWDLYPWFEPLKKMNSIQVARNYRDLLAMLNNQSEGISADYSSMIITEEICKSGKERWAKNLLEVINRD